MRKNVPLVAAMILWVVFGSLPNSGYTAPSSAYLTRAQDGPQSGDIAYLFGGDVNLFDLNTGETSTILSRVSADHGLSWSPDGSTLAFTSDMSGNAEIYTVGADGSGLQQITNTAVDEEYPSFSPQSNTLFYIRVFERTEPGINWEGHYEVVRRTHDGKETVAQEYSGTSCWPTGLQALSDNEVAIDEPCKSNVDVTLVNMITQTSVSISQIADLQTRSENGDCDLAHAINFYATTAAWAHIQPEDAGDEFADRLVAFVGDTDCATPGVQGENDGILIASTLRSSAPLRVVTSGGVTGDSLSWSPDNAWLTFGRREGETTGIWVVSTEGGEPILLTDLGYDPAWRPRVAIPTPTPVPPSATPTTEAPTATSTATPTQQPTATPTVAPPAASGGLVVVSNGGKPLTLLTSEHPGECRANCVFGDGQTVTAKVTFRNRSSMPIHIKALTVGGRGPEALQKNWGAPNRDWPTLKDFDLAPGEEYTYEQPRTFSELGDYFAEPAYQDANGHWGGIQVEGSNPATYARVTFNVISPGVTPPPPGGRVTPTPVAGFRLKINSISWDPAPSAFNPTTLTIRMAPIVGLKQGGYMVRLQVYPDYKHEPLELWYSSEVPKSAEHLEPAFVVQHSAFTIQVKNLRLPQTIFGSGIDVTVLANEDPEHIWGKLEQQPLNVAVSNESWRHCVAVLPGVIAELVPIPKTMPSRLIMELLVDLNVDTLDVMNQQALCGDNDECQARTIGELKDKWRSTLISAGFQEVAEKVLGNAAVILKIFKAVYNLFPDTAKCLSWLDRVQSGHVILMNRSGQDTNMARTGSPVYPLVTNESGQRAGFLPDGTVVEEIPGSGAVEIEEHRYVVFPGVGSFDVQITGYADGTMNVRTLFAQDNNDTLTADYADVPVVQGMSAHLESTNSAGTLQVDTDKDNQVDKSLAPTASKIVGSDAAGAQIGANTSATSVPPYMLWWVILVSSILVLSGVAFLWDARVRR